MATTSSNQEIHFNDEPSLSSSELRKAAIDFDIPYVELSDANVDEELFAYFPIGEIFRRNVLPVQRCGQMIQVVLSDPFDLETLDELGALSGQQLVPALAPAEEIAKTIKRCLGVGGGTVGDMVADGDGDTFGLESQVTNLDEDSEQRSVVKLVNELLADAVEHEASDIHIEPNETGLEIRYRIDGLLHVQPVPQEMRRFRDAIVTRIKIISKLNIAEKRLSQDGRIKLKVSGREIDIRVSIIPMLHGEGVVMRILDRSRNVFELDSLNFPDVLNTRFRELIRRPHGIMLLTGPTGSGKTTTLYSVLAEIRDPTIKIITVEDPVEYSLPGIRQIQVHDKIGRTFASGLRSILRHDPDVILVGEIRDAETARSAIQASLTGHLVFSTLHTNDSASAFARLVDMGVEPYLVASTVEGVMAQRLVRRLCDKCKVPYSPTECDLPSDFPRPLPETLFEPAGCRDCQESGYRGRLAIYELLTADEEVRRLCTQRATSGAIREHAVRSGMISLRECGWGFVQDGVTSVDEILRVSG